MHTDNLFEVVFGLEHIVAEFFWNAIFLVVGFALSKTRLLKRIHKYVDGKHGVVHEDNNY